MTAPADIAPPPAARHPDIRSHTGLRGVAALMVVLYHYKIGRPFEADLDRLTGLFEAAGIFVDMFFILSGFIMAAIYGAWFATGISTRDVGGFLLRRLARLYPLHLATLALVIILGVYSGQQASLAEIVQNLLMIHAWGMRDAFALNFPSWSISAEWFLYLVFPVLAFADARRAGRIAIAVLAVSIYAGLFAFGDGVAFDERLSLLRALPAFIAGMLIFHISAPRSPAALWIVQSAGAALVLVAMHSGFTDALVLSGFMAVIWATRDDRGPVSRAMSTGPAVWLGHVSYSIYMLHMPVLWYIQLVAGKFAPPLAQHPGQWLVLIVSLAVLFVAGHVSWRFFEMPVRRRIQRRGGPAP